MFSCRLIISSRLWAVALPSLPTFKPDLCKAWSIFSVVSMPKVIGTLPAKFNSMTALVTLLMIIA